MKNKALNTLNYSGIVTLSRTDGTHKVKIAQAHNSGYNPLFVFLADCLTGSFNDMQRPTKIKLLKKIPAKNNDEFDTYDDITGSVHLLTPPVADKSDGSRCVVRYSFIIPRDYMEWQEELDSLGLGLYARGTSDDATADFAAYCPLDLKTSDIAGASLVVDWELIIANHDYYENSKNSDD